MPCSLDVIKGFKQVRESRRDRPPRPAGGPRGGGRQADAAALAAAAASLNTFKGDGSFMESFQQSAGKPRACTQQTFAHSVCTS